MKDYEYEAKADETTIEQLEGDARRYRDALSEIVRRIRLKEDRPEVIAQIAVKALRG